MLYNYDELTFQILSVNRIKWEFGRYTVKPRSYGALAFRVSGSSNFTANNRNFTVKKGEVLFLPAGVGYDVEYSNVEMIVIHFSDCNYISETENYCFQNPDYFHRKFVEILNAWENHASPYAVNALVYNLLDAMREDKISKSIEDSVFAECVALIDEYFSNSDLNIAKVCRMKGISEATMRRKFHQYRNISPKQYLLQLRLSKAIHLLAENQNTIAEIANLCGFQDEKYFSRMIKKQYGESPSALSRKFKL